MSSRSRMDVAVFLRKLLQGVTMGRVMPAILMLVVACGGGGAADGRGAAAGGQGEGAGRQRIEIDVAGLSRSYDLFVPPGGQQYPLVLAFHGGLGSPDQFRDATGLEELARRRGFAVAFMAGTGRGNRLVWNAGGCCGMAADRNVDELSYVRAAIRQISANHPIDRQRIYLVGHSNGGMLVNHLADQLANEIAAAAMISASRFSPVPPGAPVPVFIMNSVGDTVVPYAGGLSERRIVRRTMEAPFLPAAQVARGWADRNGCSSEQRDAGGGYDTVRYQNCRDGAAVVFVTLQGSEHRWPEAPLNATQALWEFISQFRE